MAVRRDRLGLIPTPEDFPPPYLPPRGAVVPPGELPEVPEGLAELPPEAEPPQAPALPEEAPPEALEAPWSAETGLEGRDWAPDYQEAQKRAGELRRAAGWARTAEEVNAAFRRKPASYSASKDLEGLADRQVADVRTAAQLESEQLKRAKEREFSDPSSSTNRRFREVLKTRYPEVAEALGPAFDSLTQKQVEEVFNLQIGMDKAATQALRAQAAVRNYDTRSKQFDRSQAEKERHNRFMEALASARLAKADRDNLYREGIQERFDANKMYEFTKAIAKSAPEIDALQQIERLAPGLTTGSVPANFRLNLADRVKQELLGNFSRRFSDLETEQLRRAIEYIRQAERNGMFGATLTPSERAEFEKVMDSSISAGPVAMAAALSLYRSRIVAGLRPTVAYFRRFYPQETEDLLKASGITLDLSPTTSSATSASPGGTTAQPVEGETVRVIIRGRATEQDVAPYRNNKAYTITPLGDGTFGYVAELKVSRESANRYRGIEGVEVIDNGR